MAINNADAMGCYVDNQSIGFERFYRNHDPFDPQVHYANVDNYFRQLDAYENIRRKYQADIDTSYNATKKRQDERETHRRTFEQMSVVNQIHNMVKFDIAFKMAMEFDRDQQHYAKASDVKGSWQDRQAPLVDIPFGPLPPSNRKQTSNQENDMTKKAPAKAPTPNKTMQDALQAIVTPVEAPVINMDEPAALLHKPEIHQAVASKTTVTIKLDPATPEVNKEAKATKEQEMQEAKEPVVVVVQELITDPADPFVGAAEAMNIQGEEKAAEVENFQKNSKVLAAIAITEESFGEGCVANMMRRHMQAEDFTPNGHIRELMNAPDRTIQSFNERLHAATSWFRK